MIIKFRAWDKERKIMYGWQPEYDRGLRAVFADKTLLINEVRQIGEDDYELDSSSYEPENYELMRFTGLKDKNKKEIYEGDILKSILSYNGKEKILIVYWSEPVAGFMLNDINHSFGWEFGLSFRTLEVIGNIYENPELIKGKVTL